MRLGALGLSKRSVGLRVGGAEHAAAVEVVTGAAIPEVVEVHRRGEESGRVARLDPAESLKSGIGSWTASPMSGSSVLRRSVRRTGRLMAPVPIGGMSTNSRNRTPIDDTTSLTWRKRFRQRHRRACRARPPVEGKVVSLVTGSRWHDLLIVDLGLSGIAVRFAKTSRSMSSPTYWGWSGSSSGCRRRRGSGTSRRPGRRRFPPACPRTTPCPSPPPRSGRPASARACPLEVVVLVRRRQASRIGKEVVRRVECHSPDQQEFHAGLMIS